MRPSCAMCGRSAKLSRGDSVRSSLRTPAVKGMERRRLHNKLRRRPYRGRRRRRHYHHYGKPARRGSFNRMPRIDRGRTAHFLIVATFILLIVLLILR
jgi:hypothetical protein